AQPVEHLHGKEGVDSSSLSEGFCAFPRAIRAGYCAPVQNPSWLAYRVPDEVLRSPPTAAERKAEQDSAAGGRENRRVHMEDGGRATASVTFLRVSRARRAYGYLRFRYHGRNYQVYIGDASAQSREEALIRAWARAREKGLTTRTLPIRR